MEKHDEAIQSPKRHQERLFMKKILCFILIVLILAGTAACNREKNITVEETATPIAETPAPTPSRSPRPTPTPTPIPTPPPLSGTCGPLNWVVDPETRTLTISGKGAMPDFEWEETFPPWSGLGDYFLIDNPMFYDRVVIEEGVTRLGAYTFCGVALTSVSLPDSLLSIGAGVFMLGGVERLSIPKNVTLIEEGAFAVGWISAFQVASENPAYRTKDGVLFSKDMSRLISYPIASKSARYRVPVSVKHIESNAFGHNLDSSLIRLEAVILPEGLISIGDEAFAFCQILTEFKLPKSVRHIGESAFSCANVRELVLPEGMTEIGLSAFWDSRLERIIIPASVKKIGAQAFWDNWGLAVYFVGEPPELEKSEFGGFPFDRNNRDLILYYPRKLASVWAPNGETYWNGYPIEPYDSLPKITGKWAAPAWAQDWDDDWDDD